MSEKRTAFWIDPLQDPAEHGGYVPSLVTEDEAGHSPLIGDPTRFQSPWVWGDDLATAEKIADQSNAEKGLSPDDVATIILSSMAASHLS